MCTFTKDKTSKSHINFDACFQREIHIDSSIQHRSLFLHFSAGTRICRCIVFIFALILLSLNISSPFASHAILLNGTWSSHPSQHNNGTYVYIGSFKCTHISRQPKKVSDNPSNTYLYLIGSSICCLNIQRDLATYYDYYLGTTDRAKEKNEHVVCLFRLFHREMEFTLTHTRPE